MNIQTLRCPGVCCFFASTGTKINPKQVEWCREIGLSITHNATTIHENLSVETSPNFWTLKGRGEVRSPPGAVNLCVCLLGPSAPHSPSLRLRGLGKRGFMNEPLAAGKRPLAAQISHRNRSRSGGVGEELDLLVNVATPIVHRREGGGEGGAPIIFLQSSKDVIR